MSEVISQTPPDLPDTGPQEDDEEPPETETETETDGPTGIGVRQTESGEEIIPEGFALCVCCDGAGVLPMEVQEDSGTQRCEYCGGLGRVITGSINLETATRDCTRCGGNGWTIKTEPAPETRPYEPTFGASPQSGPPPQVEGFYAVPDGAGNWTLKPYGT